MRKLFHILLLLLIRAIPGPAQSIPTIWYTAENGLPSNTVYSITRDSKGYLWFSTDKGVSRYNGKEFKSFSTFDGLADNEVFSVKEDFEGRLWFNSFSGKLCYLKDGGFHTDQNTPWLKLPAVSPSTRFILERDSSITLSFQNPYWFASIKGNTCRIYKIPRTVLGEPPLSCAMRAPGQYDLIYPDVIATIDTNGKNLSIRKFKGGWTYSPTGNHNKTGEVGYYATTDGLYDLQERLVFPLKRNLYTAPANCNLIADGHVFIGIKDRLAIDDNTDIMTGQRVTFITKDTAGNFWVSTKGKGAFNFSKHFRQITTYAQRYQGQVLYATAYGDALLFVDDKAMLHEFKEGRLKTLTAHKTTDGYFARSNFLIDRFRNFFQLYPGKSFALLRQGNGSMRSVSIAPFGVVRAVGSFKEILSLGNTVYLVTANSIFTLDYRTLAQATVVNPELLIENKNLNRIFSRAVNNRDSSLWFSRTDGIFKTSGNKVFKQAQFRNIILRQFYFFGQYMVGFTDANHLLVSNNYESRPVTDTIKEPNCIWENIYVIDEHHCLISTNNYYRLLTFYPASTGGKPRFSLQTIENPFIPRQTDCIAMDSANCYFFKGGDITRVAMPILFEQSLPPIPVFSALEAQGKSYPIAPLVTLSYAASKNVTISFDNIVFGSKEVVCEYSISTNGQEEWTKITGNSINLSTPGYGPHLIQIRSRALSGNYSQPAVLTLNILKPFWATWWFVLIAILTLITLVWLSIAIVSRYRLRKKQREHEADMKYQQSEYKALNALMNPHFIFNSLNNIQGLINKDEKRVANEYLVIFSDLIRQNMSNVSKGFITLQQELNLIENYLTLEKLRFKELINYEIKVEADVETEDIRIPPLMAQPLVENAVKHGLLPKQSIESMVRIHIFEKDNLLYLEITDNGIGLARSLQSKNKLYESFGLVNLKKRTEHLKKIQQREINIVVHEIEDAEGNSMGTRALITMELENA